MDSINNDAHGPAAPAATAPSSGIAEEVGAPFLDDSDRKATFSEGLTGYELSAAVDDQTREDSLSELLELRDSPIYAEMEDFGGSLFQDDFAWNITDQGGLAEGVAAVADSALGGDSSNSFELRESPMGLEMENLDGILFADGSAWKATELVVGLAGEGVAADVDLTRENSSVNGLELGGSPVDRKMEEVRKITPSGVNSGASLITNAVDIHDDDNSNQSESGISDSSSEETESSSTSSSEEEEELDEDDVGKGDGEESLEMVLGLSEEEEEVVKGPIRSKNELENLPPVPPVEVSLELHHQTVPVGLISSIFGNQVIVEGSANHSPLHEGSILWITDTRSPLGLIDEIFGPVKCPYYVIRFNSDKDIPLGIKEGTSVSFVNEFACHVLEKDISNKGYDASGDNDEELNGELEFSDDEKEVEYRKSLRQAKRGTDDKKHGNWETGTHKKKTNMKARGSKKDMYQPITGVPGKSLGNSGAAIASYSAPLGAANTHVSTSSIPMAPSQLVLGGDFANPPPQFINQMNALPNSGVPGMQQPFLSPQFGMPIPLLHQQYGVLPFGLPLQRLPNTAVTGFQLNGLPNQQLGIEAFHHQFHNHRPSNVHNMMSYAQQLHPGPNMPSIGNNFSTSSMSPGPLGGSSYGQAYMCAQLGNCNISNEHTPASSQGQLRPHLQFNPGNSSGQRRKQTKYGGRHIFRGGVQDSS